MVRAKDEKLPWYDMKLGRRKDVSVPKKYFPITAAIAVLVLVAAFGYLRPVPADEMPTRILFDNTGGNVVFTHLAHHRDYGVACAKCHHAANDSKAKPLACGSCHAISFNKDYVDEHISSFPDPTVCVNCHHLEFHSLDFDHEAHQDYAPDCSNCHHGADIEPEPQRCSNCHSKMAGTKDMPSVRDAAHERCRTCHEDVFAEELKSCTPCHKLKDMNGYDGPFTSCSQCHKKPAKDLLLDRTSAFHDQCMGCHEQMQKGPRGEKDCGKCHIR